VSFREGKPTDELDSAAEDRWAPHIAPGVRAFRPGAVAAIFAAILGLGAAFYAWTNGERLAEEAAAGTPDSAVSGDILADPGLDVAPETPLKTKAKTDLPQ